MKKNKGHDYSTMLIWAAAVVTVVRYSAAFMASDLGEITGILSEAITFFMGLSGLGMGILDVFGSAYLFDGWRRTMPAAGKKWPFKFIVLTIFIFALMATGVFILVPFTVSRVSHLSMADVLLGKSLYLWSFLVNVAPYLLIGGVSVGNQIVTVRTENATESYRQVTGKETEQSEYPADWRKARRMLTNEQVKSIAVDQSKNIAFHFGISERTARNWRKYAQNESEQK